MGRELQKRKRRSSRPTIRQPSSRPRRLRNPLGNDTVAKNWDKNETATQNYRRLGLVARLKAPTGGAEPDHLKARTQARDPFVIQPNGGAGDGSFLREVRVERDADGKIVRILGSTEGRKRRDNPLNDPLNELDTDSEAGGDEDMADDGETWGGIEEGRGPKEDTRTEVVKELEAEANRPREKKIRGQSQREKEWVESLVEKHGENTKAMAKDRKLNPMQQTEADIVRRIRKSNGGS